MSPAVGRGLRGLSNAQRPLSPQRTGGTAAAAAGQNTGRDSFLNYFFGKDAASATAATTATAVSALHANPTSTGHVGTANYSNANNGLMPTVTSPGAASHLSMTSRHVSQHLEPSFADSIRRGDPRRPSSEIAEDEFEFSGGGAGTGMEVGGLYVSSPVIFHTIHELPFL